MEKIVTRKGIKLLVNETVLPTNSSGEIQWHVHLKNGWNSVWAKNKTIAMAKAKKEYGYLGITGLSPMTPSMERSLLANWD
jgi:hypothetical protein